MHFHSYFNYSYFINMLVLNSPTFGTIEHRWSYNSLLKFSLKLNRYFFFSFLFLINNRIVLKEKNQVHRGCTWKTVHQTLKLQRSRISKKLEQGKRLKDKLHSSKAWKNKDLRSKIDHSFPSKHLELSSHQIHHTTQWGIALHKSMLQCQPNEPCQLENKSVTLCSITQRRPKKVHTIDHNSSNRTMKKKMIRRFPTFFTHIAPINNCNTLIP